MGNNETTDQDRNRDEDGKPVAYARAESVQSFWRALAGGGFLALIVSLFVALGVSYRDYAKSVSDNLRSVVSTWDSNFEKLSDRVYELEKWRWGKRRR